MIEGFTSFNRLFKKYNYKYPPKEYHKFTNKQLYDTENNFKKILFEQNGGQADQFEGDLLEMKALREENRFRDNEQASSSTKMILQRLLSKIESYENYKGIKQNMDLLFGEKDDPANILVYNNIFHKISEIFTTNSYISSL